jgi:hypothetical protein
MADVDSLPSQYHKNNPHMKHKFSPLLTLLPMLSMLAPLDQAKAISLNPEGFILSEVQITHSTDPGSLTENSCRLVMISRNSITKPRLL